jgi:prepilin-type N-terminal cleavage/methylation domain-containing protein
MESFSIKQSLKMTPGGFTLAELLVVMAIIGIIMAGVVVGQANFNRTFVLTDTAYTIALSIRQAQSQGLSTAQFSGNNNSGFGLHFGATPMTSYLEYADTYPATAFDLAGFYGTVFANMCPGHTIVGSNNVNNPEARAGDCRYEAPPKDILAKTYTLNQGYKITKYCGVSSNSVTTCSGSVSPYLNSLDLIFLRPNIQTVILSQDNTGTPYSFDTLCLTLASPGATSVNRYIKITKLGQISVVTGPTCP